MVYTEGGARVFNAEFNLPSLTKWIEDMDIPNVMALIDAMGLIFEE